MVRTLKPQNYQIHPEEEDDDTEDVTACTDTSSHRDGKGAEQKSNNHRSKHSETEQRRRSKINERFQILKDLIPPNDQKRDKASLLLEVIEYIQFLQEKLQLYEGSYQQVWGAEPTKLTPWRANNGLGDNLTNPSLAMINGSGDENNETQAMTNIQRSVEPEFSEDTAYNRGAEHPTGPPMTAPLNIPLHPFAYLPGRSIPTTENTSQPRPSYEADCTIVGNEGGILETDSNSLSRVYSQVLLKKLSRALEMSGVDISHANISVELDLDRHSTAAASASILCPKDVGNQPRPQYEDVNGKNVYSATKRMRIGEI